MTLRWIRTREHDPGLRAANWHDDDWLLVGNGKILARAYHDESGRPADQWVWTATKWRACSGTADTFKSARAAIAFALRARLLFVRVRPIRR